MGVDPREDVGGGVGAEVGHAVGDQDDAVLAAGDEGARRQCVGLAHAVLQVGRAAALEAVEGGEDRGAVGGRRRVEEESRVVVEGDQLQAVMRGELLQQQRQRVAREADAVGLVHRARGVDEESEHGRSLLLAAEAAALDSDAHEVEPGAEGGGRPLDIDAEDGGIGGAVAVVEGVDDLLRADRLGIRQRAMVERLARPRVRGGVDVDREGREGIRARLDERVVRGGRARGGWC